jgi:hypothetical protein
MGVSYAPRCLPGSKASHAAIKKWKAEVSKKPAMKSAKAGLGITTSFKTVPQPLPKTVPAKKISILKIA